jgi:hypothetical protein
VTLWKKPEEKQLVQSKEKSFPEGLISQQKPKRAGRISQVRSREEAPSRGNTRNKGMETRKESTWSKCRLQ